MIPLENRSRLWDSLVRAQGESLRSQMAAGAVVHEIAHQCRRPKLRALSYAALRRAEEARAELLAARDAVLELTAPWDGITDRRAA